MIRSRWLLHHAALHERALQAGREPSAHERMWETARTQELRDAVEFEVRAAGDWWARLEVFDRAPLEEVEGDDSVERQVGAFRTALAWTEEAHAAELARYHLLFARQAVLASREE